MKKSLKRYLPYFIVILIGIIIFTIKINTTGFFAPEELGVFLTVIGLIYGLLTAFTISNTWERFSILRNNIGEETSSFKNIHLMSKFMSDKKIKEKVSEKISDYCEEAIKTDYNKYPESKSLHKKFRSLFDEVCKIKPKPGKEFTLFWSLLGEIRDASTARIHQLVSIQTPISKSRWAALYTLSIIIVAGFLAVELPNKLIGSLTGTGITLVVLLLLLLVRELNDLSFEFEGITIEPYRKVLNVIRGGE